jgi:hypothetical protein
MCVFFGSLERCSQRVCLDVTISAGRYESVEEFYFACLAAFHLRCPPQRVCQNVVAVGVSVCGYYQQAPMLSKISFRKCFKSCSPMSDLATRYDPQATTRFTRLF